MGALQRLDEMRNGKYHAWSMATALKVQASTALYVAIIVKDVVPTGSHCVPPPTSVFAGSPSSASSVPSTGFWRP